MPECLLLAYHDNLDRLRAERQLDLSQATAYPHLAPDARKSWLKDNQRRRARPIVAPAQPTGGQRTAGGALPFSVDGHPVDGQGLRLWLGAAFGGASPLRPSSAGRGNGHVPAQGRAR